MGQTATIAIDRLRSDQAMLSIASSRSRLVAVGTRLDIAARATLTQGLVEKVRTDRRFAPALQCLVRIALGR